MALISAAQPAVHCLEVTFRNHLFRASERLLPSRSGTPLGWLDASPSVLHTSEAERVSEAKRALHGKTITVGRLIAELDFGFWVSLCRRPYEQGRTDGPRLWPAIFRYGFPGLPKAMRSRAVLLERFDAVRQFRNRMSHHEPIWNQNPLRQHSQIVEATRWMNPAVGNLLECRSRLPAVHASGLEPFLRDAREWLITA